MVISFLPNARMHLIQLVLQMMIRNVKGRQNLLLFTIISKERFKRTTIMVKGQGNKWMVIDRRLKIICETFLAASFGIHDLFQQPSSSVVFLLVKKSCRACSALLLLARRSDDEQTATDDGRRRTTTTTRRRRDDDCSSLLPLSPLNSKGVHTI